ncbi:MAG: metal-dependent hydrolase [Bacteroidetes bacterium]|nr:MAG: metal-dependent hydrolase [Bacteroidota bacterium]
MDILIHTLTGMCGGTVVAALHRSRPAQQARIVVIGGLGGMFPDIDTFSLWPGFDQTFGAWLGQSGREIYSSHLWYGHHGFFHSLVGALLLTGLLGGFFSLIYSRILRRAPGFGSAFRYLVPYQISFLGGYLLHLVEDMPTPGGSWGGIRLLFPSQTYIGGWGYTWWWNNYDIFLIVSGTLLLSLLALMVCEWRSRRLRFIPVLLLLFGSLLAMQQLHFRQTDYNECAYPACETASWEEQERNIGKAWTRRLRQMDNLLPIYF